jgi:hypothetical protein
MTITKHHNYEYDAIAPGGLPNAVADRYYAQDLFRDFAYLIDRLGQVYKDILKQVPLWLEGGDVVQGAGATLNITIGHGYVAKSVQTRLNSALPPTTQDEDIEAIRVDWAAQTNMALPSYTPGGSTNYVKVRYKELDGLTRQRAKGSGTYAYEQSPSYEFVVDTSVPTKYDLCLITFTEAAGVFTFTQYYPHRIGANSSQIIIHTPTDFNNIWERVAANQYKLKDHIKSVHFQYYQSGAEIGFTVANLLSGGDTWGAFQTNNCTEFTMSNGSRIYMVNERSYIEVNTDNCYLKNISVEGTGTVASAIAQSFLLNANYVTFDNCRTSNRLSNVLFECFKGSATSLHNVTSKYINCSVYNMTSSAELRGFNGCHNLVNSLVYNIESTSNSCAGLYSCVNVVNNMIQEIDSAITTRGINAAINSCNSRIENLDSSGGQSRGIDNSISVSNAYIFDLQSPLNFDVVGIRNTNNISVCKIEQLDTLGTGVVYGMSGCNQVSVIEITDLDGADDVNGVYQCNQVSSCYVYDLDSGSGPVRGFYDCDNVSAFSVYDLVAQAGQNVVGLLQCDNISAFKVNQLDISGAGTMYGMYQCNQSSAFELNDLTGVGATFGIWNSFQFSAFKIINADSTTGNLTGIYNSYQFSDGRLQALTCLSGATKGLQLCGEFSGLSIYDLQSSSNYDVNGIESGSNFSACKIEQLDTSGTGIVYGIKDSFQVSACEITDLDGASAVYGMDDVDQISSCLIDDLQSTGGILHGINNSDNISSCKVSNLTGANGSIVYGYFVCGQVSACDAKILDSTNADVYAFRTVVRASALNCFDIDETGASDAYGFRDCNQIAGCYADNIDSSAGNAYGYNSCDYGAALNMTEAVNPNNDYIDTTDVAITNKFSCHPTNWT